MIFFVRRDTCTWEIFIMARPEPASRLEIAQNDQLTVFFSTVTSMRFLNRSYRTTFSRFLVFDLDDVLQEPCWLSDDESI
jgi:hypothetical protein